MCGRFTLRTLPSQWGNLFLPGFDPAAWDQGLPRYNIAPTQNVMVVFHNAAHAARELSAMRWGLVPSWANDLSIGNRMINARSETVAEKPAFRVPLRQRRCLIPADGYYEWKAQSDGKQPYFFHRREEALFAFAGLYEFNSRVTSKEAPLRSCTILTTNANVAMSEYHDRMPVILPESMWDVWLDPELQDATAITSMLRPAAEDLLTVRPVDRFVNSARHEGPNCLRAPTTHDANDLPA